jgi:hypothetical protein
MVALIEPFDVRPGREHDPGPFVAENNWVADVCGVQCAIDDLETALDAEIPSIWVMTSGPDRLMCA